MNGREKQEETVGEDHSLGQHTHVGTSLATLGQQTGQSGWS